MKAIKERIIYQDKHVCRPLGWLDYGLLFPFILYKMNYLCWEKKSLFLLYLDYDKMKTVHLPIFFYSLFKSHIAIIRLLFQLLFSVDWSKPGVWFWIKSAFRSAARATWQLRSEFWQILRMHFILLPPSFISLAPSAKI